MAIVNTQMKVGKAIKTSEFEKLTHGEKMVNLMRRQRDYQKKTSNAVVFIAWFVGISSVISVVTVA